MRIVLAILAVLGPVALFAATVRRALGRGGGAGPPASTRAGSIASAAARIGAWIARPCRRPADDEDLGRRRRIALTFATVLLGAMLFVPAWLLEGWVEYYAGLGEHARVGTDVTAMVYALFVAAPLEQGLKVLAVTPAWRSRYFAAPADGVLFGAAAALGFVSAHDAGLLATGGFAALDAARAILAAPAHLFFGAAWGYALGREARDRAVKRFGGRVFNATWLFAMLFNGVYDHIVFGRTKAALLATMPMLLAMGIVSLVVGRSLAGVTGPGPRLSIVPRLSLAPPSMGAVRAALWRTERPVMVRWIGIGALVQMGVITAAIAGAVALGHRAGVDFAAVDRGDGGTASAAPLAAPWDRRRSAPSPVAGYLVARASASRGRARGRDRRGPGDRRRAPAARPGGARGGGLRDRVRARRARARLRGGVDGDEPLSGHEAGGREAGGAGRWPLSACATPRRWVWEVPAPEGCTFELIASARISTDRRTWPRGVQRPRAATTTGTAPAEGAPPGPASSSPGGPLGGGIMPLLIMVLPILLIFMTMRGQTKKQKQIESNLKTGDTVVTQSGLIGKLTDLGESRVKVEIAPGVSVKMLKSAITGIDTGEVKTADAKDKPQEKKA